MPTWMAPIPGLLRTIEEKKALDDQIKNDMVAAIKEAKERFLAEKGEKAAAAAALGRRGRAINELWQTFSTSGGAFAA